MKIKYVSLLEQLSNFTQYIIHFIPLLPTVSRTLHIHFQGTPPRHLSQPSEFLKTLPNQTAQVPPCALAFGSMQITAV